MTRSSDKMELVDRLFESSRLPNAFRPSHEEFASFLRSLIEANGYRSICDIGGGKKPCLPVSVVDELGLDYYVVDVSKTELDGADARYNKIHSAIEDLQGDEQFDLMFSNMVFEHIEDNLKAYKIVYRALKPGGMCVNLHPTLFALPFVLNKILPEKLGWHILSFFVSERKKPSSKFPAFYSLCRVTRAVEENLLSTGFRDVRLVPFYGHPYYREIPFAHWLQQKFANVCRRMDLRLLASYCITVVKK